MFSGLLDGIHVAGSATSHWCPDEGEVLVQMLRKLASARAECDLYIVSPFRAVAQQARDLVRRRRELEAVVGDLDSFVQERIGTVHTVQGREAEAVILMLGAAEPSQQGARVWAGASPNLVNVAVTRAKERLYVIGNRGLWKTAGYFKHLDARLG